MLVVGLFWGCSGDKNPTGGGGDPTISISLSASSLSLEQAPSGLAPPAQSNEQQESGSSTVTLTRSGGFTGAVSLVVEGAPSGVTATAAPTSIAAGSTSSVVSISAGATAAPGSYTLTVRATGSGVTAATATLALTVTARPIPTFSIAAAPASLGLAQGANGPSTLTITRGGGFTGDVTLAVTGMPTGMTAVAAPATTSGTTSTVTVTVGASVAAGTYPLTVTGTTTGLTDQTATISVTVTEAVTGSYTLTMDPATLSIAQGAQLTSTIQINRTGGFAGDVSIAVSGLPAGVTATLDPPSSPEQTEAKEPVGDAAGPEATTGNSVTLTLSVGAGVTPGETNLTLTGTATGLEPQTTGLMVTVTETVPESFSLSLNPGGLSIPQGANATTAVTITRGGGFAGDVALAVSGMPGGMTATAVPASTGGDNSTVTVTVGAGVAIGTYPLVVTGSTGTLTDQTANLSVQVTAGGGTGGNVTFAFCDESDLPIWVAYQDGNGPWMQAAGVNHSYNFNISSARGAVAFVTDEGMGEYITLVYHGTSAELTNIGGNLCDTDPGTSKTVNGSVAGLGVTDQSTVTLGGSAASVLGAGPGLFSLLKVSEGPQDLLATRTSLSGITFTRTLEQVIIRRNLNPFEGSTLPVLDFGTAEAFAPVIRNLTINSLGTDIPIVSLSYQTANGGSAFLYNDFTGTTTFPTIGAGKQAAGDLHSLNVLAAEASAGVDNNRGYNTFFVASADKTVNLGPSFGGVTVTTASAAPYARLQSQHTVQSEYASMWTLNFSQAGGSSVGLIITSGHQGGAATVDYAIPDFTSAAGWNNAWGLVPGTEVAWVVGGTGWTGAGGVIGSPLIDGAIALSAARWGTIIP